MNVGFIIPKFKNPEQIKRCREAIGNLKTEHEFSVHEHDNNKTNLGFTKAINIGLTAFCDGMTDYCVVLNQDCYLTKDFLDKAVGFMENHPNCFIGGVKQLSAKDEDVIVHGGCTTAFPEGRHIVGRVSMNSCSKNKRMQWVNGACLIVNMNMLSRIGMMDENFWLIGSDSDWCYTARARGAEVWYIADAVVVHEEGVSAKRSSKELETKKMLDMIYFRDKWIVDGLFRELSMEVFG